MSQKGITYLSKQKHEELLKELVFLKTTRRKEIAEKLEYAKSLGDLSENAEYHEAREDQSNTERRILELEALLKDVKVVEKHHSEKVEIGSVVRVLKKGDKIEKVFQIVGSEEADTSAGKISNVSPLGKAIFGKKKDDTVIFHSPKGEAVYKIVEIE